MLGTQQAASETRDGLDRSAARGWREGGTVWGEAGASTPAPALLVPPSGTSSEGSRLFDLATPHLYAGATNIAQF